MKRLDSLTFCLALLFFCGFIRSVPCQSLQAEPRESKSTCGTLTKVQSDWKRLNQKWFSLCLPGNAKPLAANCIESGCYGYDLGQYRVYIEVSSHAFRPSHEKDLAGYWEKVYWISEDLGESAWLWRFEGPHGSNRFHSGALFTRTKGKPLTVGIIIVSITFDPAEIALKSFATFNFAPLK